MATSEVVLPVNLVNFVHAVTNHPSRQVKLDGGAGSHKVHEVHKCSCSLFYTAVLAQQTRHLSLTCRKGESHWRFAAVGFGVYVRAMRQQ